MGSPTVKSIAAELDELRAQIAALTGRLTELSKLAGAESAPAAATPAPAPVAPALAPPAPAEISEEILIALSAAVAYPEPPFRAGGAARSSRRSSVERPWLL